jgi:zinc transport system substrate-binding protein
VVASFYSVAEAVRRVGGDEVRVHDLTPPGVEPHDLELTSDDIDVVDEADLIVYLGQGFQPALEDVVDRVPGEKLDLLAGQRLRDAPGGEEDEHGRDPHVWLDPRRWSEAPGRIAEALARIDPGKAEGYRDRARAYAGQLRELDRDIVRGLSDCPRRVVVTSHAAFGYLTDRYGLEQQAISGVSPDAEPDPRRLAELADLVSREGVTTIFTETLVSPEVAETLAREAGVRVRTLNPIEGLTRRQAEDGATYLSLMRANLRALRAGLGCR